MEHFRVIFKLFSEESLMAEELLLRSITKYKANIANKYKEKM